MEFYNNNLFYFSLCLGCFLLQFVWLRICSQNNSEKEKGDRNCLVDAIFCFCLALAVSTLFRLFPGNNRVPAEDSSVFLYIGKRMTEGKIPYRDLFDHKGPILYFIEYLGIKISKTDYTGVWLLEALNILITIVFMREKIKKEKKTSKVAVFLI